MKTLQKKISLILLVMAVLSGLSACGDGTASPSEGTTDTPTREEIVDIIANSGSEYAIVISESAEEGIQSVALSLKKFLKERYGAELEIKSDFERESVGIVRSDFEILVGATNRNESKQLQDGLRADDYVIDFSTTRLSLIGGSDAALAEAVQYFCESVSTDTSHLSLPKGYHYEHRGIYAVGDISVNGVSLTDYTIIYDKDSYANVAFQMQQYFLEECGYSLPVSKGVASDRTIFLSDSVNGKMPRALDLVFSVDHNGIIIAGKANVLEKNLNIMLQAVLNSDKNTLIEGYTQKIEGRYNYNNLLLDGVEIDRYVIVADNVNDAAALYFRDRVAGLCGTVLSIVGKNAERSPYEIVFGSLAVQELGEPNFNQYKMALKDHKLYFASKNVYFTEIYPVSVFFNDLIDSEIESILVRDPFNIKGNLPFTYAGNVLENNVGPVDKLTTTQITPWLKNYHATTAACISAERTGSDSAQVIVSYAVSPHNPDIQLSGTDTVGLYKSVDGGHKWYPNSNGLALGCITYIAFDPYDENTVWLMNGFANTTNYVDGATYCGLYKSTDCGDSWTLELSLMNARLGIRGNTIAFGPKDKNGQYDVYVVSNRGDGLWRLHNGTWSCLGFEGDNLHDLYVNRDGRQIAVTSDKDGVIVSQDNAVSFVAKNNGVKEGQRLNQLEVHPTNDMLWIGMCDEGIYRSENGGDDWILAANRTALSSSSAAHSMLRIGAADSTGHAMLYVGLDPIGTPLRFSSDYGDTFDIPYVETSLNLNMGSDTGFFCPAIAVHPTEHDTVFCGFTGIYLSRNSGESFYLISEGYSGLFATKIIFDQDENLYMSFIDVGMGIGLRDYEGNYPPFEVYSSVRVQSARGSQGLIYDPKDPLHIIYNISGGREGSEMFETFDGGKTQQMVYETTDVNGYMGRHQDDYNFLYAGQYYSEDGGKTWGERQYSVYTVSPINNDICCAFVNGVVYVSTDRGATFNVAVTGFTAGSFLIFDHEDEMTMWATCNDRCFRKLNLKTGETKILSTNFIGSTSWLRYLAQNPDDTNHFILATVEWDEKRNYACVYESFDGGVTWHVLEGFNFHCNQIATFTFHPSRPEIWIGTQQGTIVYNYDVYKAQFYS